MVTSGSKGGLDFRSLDKSFKLAAIDSIMTQEIVSTKLYSCNSIIINVDA